MLKISPHFGTWGRPSKVPLFGTWGRPSKVPLFGTWGHPSRRKKEPAQVVLGDVLQKSHFLGLGDTLRGEKRACSSIRLLIYI